MIVIERVFNIIFGISYVLAVVFCLYYMAKKRTISFLGICIIILFSYQLVDISKEVWVLFDNKVTKWLFVSNNWNRLFLLPIDLILISSLIKESKGKETCISRTEDM